MPKQQKKAKDSKEKKDFFEQIKEHIPESLIPDDFDKEKISKFLGDVYVKGSEALKIGAKKVGEASEKIAQSTKLYYQFNQSKIKAHLLHAKIGEAVEKISNEGADSADLNSEAIKKLLQELKNEKSAMAAIKKELGGIKF